MTEEQIKQKAEYFATHLNGEKTPFSSREYEAYIAGAHSMLEEVKELNGKLAVKDIELMSALAKLALLQQEIEQKKGE